MSDITRSEFLRLSTGMFLSLLCGQSVLANAIKAKSSAKQKKLKTRPNFLIIMADDMGNHLSCLGTKGFSTPNLDKLASQGVMFKYAYSTCASCSPARASLLTGMYPHSNGIWHNVIETDLSNPGDDFKKSTPWNFPIGLNTNIPTASEIFNRAGYYTGISQKLHVGPFWKFPFQYMDVWDYNLDRKTKGIRKTVYQGARHFFETSKQKHQPFFVFTNLMSTHRPFHPYDKKQTNLPPVDPNNIDLPPVLQDTPTARKDYADYLNTVQMVDSQTGEILDALKESGLDENTIVVFITDQGIAYQKAKASPYEAGTRIPMIIKGPGIAKGRISNEFANLIDVLPTFMDYAGIKPLDNIQGISLKKQLQANPETLNRKYMFTEHTAHGPDPASFYPSRAVRNRRYKYIKNLTPDLTYKLPDDLRLKEPWKNEVYDELVNDKEKFPVQYAILQKVLHRPAEELYDLQNDPDELNNLLQNRPLSDEVEDELKDLRCQLDKWCKDTGDKGINLKITINTG